MKTRNILPILAILMLLALSCRTIGGGLQSPTAPPASIPSETTQIQEPPAADFLPDLMDSGVVSVQSLNATMEETIGGVLDIQVKNDSQQPVTVTIPCGLIFEPVAGELQPLMVFQEISASLAPGEQTSLTPQVACVDIESGVPELSAQYRVGDLAQGDLLQLAQCLCTQDIDLSPEGFDLVNIQFAIWMVSNGDILTDFPEQPVGPLQDLLENSDMSTEDLEAFQQMFEQISSEWLDRCNLNTVP